MLSWAVLGIAQEWQRGSVTSVRVCISLLHLCVGLLFIFRAPLRKDASLPSIAITALSFLACGVAFKLAPPTHEWPTAARALFVVGTGVAIVSLLQLGRSFAVFAAVRKIVVRGPYRIVRHPAYAGEFLLLTSCFLAHIRWEAFAVLCGALLGEPDR